jgi:hypothetical protein
MSREAAASAMQGAHKIPSGFTQGLAMKNIATVIVDDALRQVEQDGLR